MKTNWIILVLSVCVIASGVVGHGVSVGLGGGFWSQAQGFSLSAVEFFAETNPAGVFSPRFTVCYLPPLLLGEKPAAWLDIGYRFALGGVVRPQIGVGGGVVVERRWVGTTRAHPALSAAAGLEVGLTEKLSLYGRAGLVYAFVTREAGSSQYFYFPWSIGISLSTAAVRPARVHGHEETGLP